MNENSESQTGKLFSSPNDFQDVVSRLSKLYKLKADGLTPPTFTPTMIKVFDQVLTNTKAVHESIKSSKPKDIIYAVSDFIPRIVELSSHNFLPRTIKDFQFLVSNLYKMIDVFDQSVNSQKDIKVPIEKIKNLLIALLQKVLIISFNKAPSSIFTHIQNSIHMIQGELHIISNNPSAQSYDRFNSILNSAIEADKGIVHIIAAHSFISIAETLQNYFRNFAFDGTISITSLPNLTKDVFPMRPPIDTTVVPDYSEPKRLLQDYLKEDRNDEDMKEKFIDRFTKSLEKEFVFDSCTPAIDSLINIILVMQPPPDIKKKVFSKCSMFFLTVSRVLTYFYKIPTKVYSKNDIQQFLKHIEMLKDSADSLLKARKKPVGWSATSTQEYMNQVKPLVDVSMMMEKVVDVVDSANKIVDKSVFYANFLTLVPVVIYDRFMTPCFVSNKKLSRFNLIRAINVNKDLLDRLSAKGIKMWDPSTNAIRPISFNQLFKKIRKGIEKLEIELFNLSINHFNKFPLAKNGVTIVSAFEELSRKLELMILSMRYVPLEIAGLREFSIILFENNFEMGVDNIFIEINNYLYQMFEVYQVFENFERCGLISVTSAAHVIFLLTVLDSLVHQWPDLRPFVDYLEKINFVTFNALELSMMIKEYLPIATKALMSWSCADFVSRFIAAAKPVYSCYTLIKRVPSDQLMLKLLAQFNSWIGNLQRTQPKQNNLREMNVRMMILRKLLIEFSKGNNEAVKSQYIDQIITVIDYFPEMRELFAQRSKLKILLTYMERVSSEFGLPFEEIMKHELAPRHDIVKERTDVELGPFVIHKEEKELWKSFLDMVFKKERHSIYPQIPNYTEKIIHNRTRQVLDFFLIAWDGAVLMENEVHFLEEAISKGSFKDDLFNYIEFYEKSILHINALFETVMSVFNEFNPPSRGRGYPRERPVHPKANQIGEVQKQMQLIKEDVSYSNFKWLSRLMNALIPIFSIFKTSDAASNNISPIIVARKLIFCSVTFFRLKRFLDFVKDRELPDFEPDFCDLKFLMSFLLTFPRFIHEELTIMKYEIDQVLNGNAGNNYSVLLSSIKILRRSRSIFDVKELSSCANSDFFDFREFFSKVPSDHNSLVAFLHSKIFSIFCSNYSVVIDIIKSNFSIDFITKVLCERLEFRSEIENFNSNSVANNAKMNESFDMLFALVALSDVVHGFDQICPVFNKHETHRLNGIEFLKLELLVYELQTQVEILVHSSPQKLCKLYIDVTRLMFALKRIPPKFGPRKTDKPVYSDLTSAWSKFDRTFSVNDFRKDVIVSSGKILEALERSTVTDERLFDIKLLSSLVKEFLTQESKELLLKLRFAFLFVGSQIKRYIDFDVDLPFSQVDLAINSMLAIVKINELIHIISQQLIIVTGDTSIRYNELRYEELEVPVQTEREFPDLLDKQLSLEDQVLLTEMIAKEHNEVMKIKEDVAEIPFLEREIAELDKKIEEKSKSKASLNELIEQIKSESINIDGESSKLETLIKEIDRIDRQKDLDIEISSNQNKYASLNSANTYQMERNEIITKEIIMESYKESLLKIDMSIENINKFVSENCVDE